MTQARLILRTNSADAPHVACLAQAFPGAATARVSTRSFTDPDKDPRYDEDRAVLVQVFLGDDEDVDAPDLARLETLVVGLVESVRADGWRVSKWRTTTNLEAPLALVG